VLGGGGESTAEAIPPDTKADEASSAVTPEVAAASEATTPSAAAAGPSANPATADVPMQADPSSASENLTGGSSALKTLPSSNVRWKRPLGDDSTAGTKKWKAQDQTMIGLVEVVRSMAEQQMAMTPCGADVLGGVCLVGAVGSLDPKGLLMSAEYREKLRIDEIKQLADFGNYKPISLRVALERVAREMIYKSLWVDSDEKSRLALQDRKSYGKREGEITHCHTPAAATNALLELYASLTGLPMFSFDIVNAFPHSPEALSDIFMWPPAQWYLAEEGSQYTEAMLSEMMSALYGRQTAGADFRD
jgi:hypothetical protein